MTQPARKRRTSLTEFSRSCSRLVHASTVGSENMAGPMIGERRLGVMLNRLLLLSAFLSLVTVRTTEAASLLRLVI